jgi:hypothetical protein
LWSSFSSELVDLEHDFEIDSELALSALEDECDEKDDELLMRRLGMAQISKNRRKIDLEDT